MSPKTMIRRRRRRKQKQESIENDDDTDFDYESSDSNEGKDLLQGRGLAMEHYRRKDAEVDGIGSDGSKRMTMMTTTKRKTTGSTDE